MSYNEFDFHAKSSSGNITDPELASDNNDLGSGQLSAGGNAEGDIIFQVPQGDHGAELTWSPSFFENSDANGWLLGL